MAVNLYEHQKQAVNKLRSGSVLCGGVGTGKSRTAIAYFVTKVCHGKIPRHGSSEMVLPDPKNLYIITTARKRDTREWDAELAPFLLTRDSGPVKVVIDSWNNIAKYVDVENSFFIFDEQRLVGTGKWTKSFWKIAKKNQWILLTATPGDNWLDYAPIFIANGFYRNITEFRNLHVVYRRFSDFPQVDHYERTNRLEQIRKQIEKLGIGSAQSNVSPLQIGKIQMVLPPQELLLNFEDKVKPILNKILCLSDENVSLTKQRDELLPLLMNGQVNFDLSDD